MSSFYLETAKELIKEYKSNRIMASAVTLFPPTEDDATVEEVPQIPRESVFSRTYYSFSGADAIVYLDDTVIGEVQSIVYRKLHGGMVTALYKNSDYYDRYLIPTHPVVVVLDHIMFYDTYPAIERATNIRLVMRSEGGHRQEYIINDLMVVSEEMAIDIDQIITGKRYVLAARDVVESRQISEEVD